LSTNPLTIAIAELQLERQKSSSELQDWFQGLNLEQENSNLLNAERMTSKAKINLHQAQQAVSGLESSVKKLELKVSMGVDPRYWFSSERAVAKRQLVEVRKDLVAQQSRVAGIKIEISKAAELASKIKAEIAIARTFDPLLAQSAITGLQANLDRIEPLLASLYPRRDDLDEDLKEPLISIRRLKSERDVIMRRIYLAERFESSLSNARYAHERAKIHGQCNSELGESTPGTVMRQSKSALRGVDDKLGKLQARVDSLIRFATLDIRHIVIDGNNLCYEGSRFLKLAALEALVPILVRKYKVTLIFDASIRRKMGLYSKDIEALFPQAERVHICASKRSADETVLAVAGDDPQTFVLSNDRFVDYPEKMVVKGGRVLRHEIVSQAAHIHDLRITARFDNAPDAEAVSNVFDSRHARSEKQLPAH
jgi:hypothetical protein